ncbi:MAG: hypothetical protein GF419_13835, partial [Ignavibacteriales bacterium]|nr:hypothetical protein [Ignavibacteriales bacterium]
LWHVLHFAEDPEWIEEHALERLGMSAEQASKFAHVHLEKDYGNLSTKALGKILPYLKEGYEYSEACAKAGYHHSWDEAKDGKDRELEPIAVFHDEGVVNSPIVKRAIYETISLVNDVAKKYGKPNEVRLEMARELKKPKDVREKMRKGNQEKEKIRDKYREFLKEKIHVEPSGSDILKFELWLELEFDERDLEKRNGDVDIEEYKKFAKNVSIKGIEKFRLWLECDRISVYTGKPISLDLLFSTEIEVEHIVPYSRSMDNSFVNKTLSEKSFNNEKKNRLPMEYLKGRPEEKAYKARVKNFSQGKREKLLMERIPEDFLNSQLNNTAYVAVEVKKCLKQAYRSVRITNGKVTGILRSEWGLNGLLRDPDAEGVSPAVKSRADHRHHAIDALVVALTTDGIVNRLSRLSQQDLRVKKPISSLKTEQDVESIKDREDRDLVLRHIKERGGMENIRKALEEPILYDPTGDGSTRTLRWMYMNSVPLPWGGMKPSVLRRKVEEKLKTLFVSHRNKKRLVSSKLNKYKYRRGDKLKQKTFGPRGALHEETNFGVIEDSHRGGETIYVTRKPIETISTKKHIEKIVDPEIRKIILRHVEKNGGKIPAAMKVPIFYNAKKSGKEIPLKTVRMEEKKSNPIQIRPEKNKKLFVASGANYAVGVYEDEEGERAFEVLRFYDAVQKRLRGERLFPPELDGKKFAFTLKHNDMVVVYKESPDEIDWDDKEDLFDRLYKVVKYSSQTIIGKKGKTRLEVQTKFRKHNLAKVAEGKQDPAYLDFRFGVNILKHCVKVEVDRLGTIVRR